MVRYVLEHAGHTVITTDHGRDVERHLEQKRPDLLMLDIMLPGIDGYTLLGQLATNPEKNTIPVIVMSVLDSAKTLFDRYPQVRSFLNKPFQPDDMLAKVTKALEKKK